MRTLILAIILSLCAYLYQPVTSQAGSYWYDGHRFHKIKRNSYRKKKHHRKAKPSVKKTRHGTPLISLRDLPRCDDRMFSVTSTPHQTIDEAKRAARKLWRAQTQMLIGGAYMNPERSTDRKWLCEITDPLDAARDKMAGNIELYRCYFAARPCREMIEEESDLQRGAGYR
jgi:hypothetical protein